MIGEVLVVDGYRVRVVTKRPFFMQGYGPVHAVEMIPPIRFSVGVCLGPINAYIRESDLDKARRPQ